MSSHIEKDVVVVGGGHAGIEAAYAAARAGCETMLVTANIDMIGHMSCNPAIGGIAKGTIVREIDALGGIMGRAIDRAGIHFRMLNTSKGIAVWGNRAQADKQMYRLWVRKYMEGNEKLSLYQGMVTAVLENEDKVSGVLMETGERIHAKAIVFAMGTFLNGIGHIGMNSFACGRSGEPPSLGLSESIQSLGIEVGRLKTGTPARIDGRTVDFSQLRAQPGDDEPWPFSYSTEGRIENKTECWMAKTTVETHSIIKENISLSALYGGKITGIGPRYCPSIEDKIVRFGDRDGHTLFLEPEGLDHSEIYLNGLSTSMPFDVQLRMVKSVHGLQNARIIRPAYAIEYDYFPPVQLYSTLESRIVPNLYFAGQINGTSGYEEAACQGLIAGLNAACKVKGKKALVLGRETSYTGVLIDDLVTKGTDEPYRMFTSRAEYRLMLRHDNADIRLMPVAWKMGIIEKNTYEKRKRFWEEKKRLVDLLTITPVTLKDSQHENARRQKAKEYLKRPDVNLKDLLDTIGHRVEDREMIISTQADIKYEGFVAKQREEIKRVKRMEQTPIPQSIDYDSIEGLLTESKQKMKKIKPQTIGQASRISGVTPSDISMLIMHVSRIKR